MYRHEYSLFFADSLERQSRASAARLATRRWLGQQQPRSTAKAPRPVRAGLLWLRHLRVPNVVSVRR